MLRLTGDNSEWLVVAFKDRLLTRAAQKLTRGSDTSGRVGFDEADPFHQTSWLDGDQFEAEVSVSLFVNLFKTHGFLKADAPRFGRRDEAKMANEEDPVLVDCLLLDTLQLTGQNGRKRVPEVDCQRRGTHPATVVKLNLIRLIRRSNLTVPL